MAMGYVLWFGLLQHLVRHAVALKSHAAAQRVERQRSRLAHLLDGCKSVECVQRYVDLPDDSFTWHDTGVSFRGKDEYQQIGWTGHVLNVTSQTWEPGNTDHPLWWHTVIVVEPDNLAPPSANVSDFATLSLDFGANLGDGRLIRFDNRLAHEPLQDSIQQGIEVSEDTLNNVTNALLNDAAKAAFIATRTRALAVSVLNLPNAAETFKNDPSGMPRGTDFFKSYTYNDYMDHLDEPERLMEFPVAKAVVRAMDAVTAYSAARLKRKLQRFGITAYSKLATATFVAAAVDSRVKVIAPGAIYQELYDTLPPVKYFPGDGKFGRGVRPTSFHDAYEEIVHVKEEHPEIYARLHEFIDIDLPMWRERIKVPIFWFLGTNDFLQEWPRALGIEAQRAQEFHDRGGSFLELLHVPHEDTLLSGLPMVVNFFRGYLLGVTPPVVDFAYDAAQKTITVTQASEHSPIAVEHFSGHFGGNDRDFVGTPLQPAVKDGRLTWACPMNSSSTSKLFAGDGDFVRLTFEWPQPGDHFDISTPMYRSSFPVAHSHSPDGFLRDP